jgi:hypothetical protein
MEQGRGRDIMQTNEYHVNVFVENDIVNIACYRMFINSEGNLGPEDTISDHKTLSISISETDEDLKEVIRFALDSEYYDGEDERADWIALHGEWQSYWAGENTWESSVTFSENAEGVLGSFLDSLPFYEPKPSPYSN